MVFQILIMPWNLPGQALLSSEYFLKHISNPIVIQSLHVKNIFNYDNIIWIYGKKELFYYALVWPIQAYSLFEWNQDISVSII